MKSARKCTDEDPFHRRRKQRKVKATKEKDTTKSVRNGEERGE